MKRPLPEPTPETRPFWDAIQERRVVLPFCKDTGKCFFPPRIVSPFTGGDVEWRAATGGGILESFVIQENPGPGFEGRTPYAIVMARLDEGIRFISTISEVTHDQLLPKLGARLAFVFEESDGFLLPAFELVEGA